MRMVDHRQKSYSFNCLIEPIVGRMDGTAQICGIADLARAYGVSFRTLRFYEERGFLRPLRSGTVRHYSAKDRIRLELILRGKRLGFSLAEIERLILSDDEAGKRLQPDRIKEQMVALERKRDEISQAIEELRAAGTRRTIDHPGDPAKPLVQAR